MAKSIQDTPKKKRGRPKQAGRGEGIMVRLQKQELRLLDDWIAKQQDALSRPAALRQMLREAVAEAMIENGKAARKKK